MGHQLISCQRGHPLSGDNVKIEPSTGVRRCVTCRRVNDREADQRRTDRRRAMRKPRRRTKPLVRPIRPTIDPMMQGHRGMASLILEKFTRDRYPSTSPTRGAVVITADQILAHLVGDYILQSHWMAQNKTKQSFAAGVHAVSYTLPFAFLTWNPAALAFICLTHFVIDRFRIARWVVWIKNGYALEGEPTATGYLDDVPAWLSVWLLIIADNTIHLILNGIALAVWL